MRHKLNGTHQNVWSSGGNYLILRVRCERIPCLPPLFSHAEGLSLSCYFLFLPVVSLIILVVIFLIGATETHLHTESPVTRLASTTFIVLFKFCSFQDWSKAMKPPSYGHDPGRLQWALEPLVPLLTKQWMVAKATGQDYYVQTSNSGYVLRMSPLCTRSCKNKAKLHAHFCCHLSFLQ